MRCLYSARAVDDLEDIAEYIARDNPQRALSFIGELRTRCEQFVTFPLNAPLRPDIAEGIRMVPFGRYLILYSIAGDDLLIERIAHGARDIGQLFGGTTG
jgi:toxin ParE1/3/4